MKKFRSYFSAEYGTKVPAILLGSSVSQGYGIFPMQVPYPRHHYDPTILLRWWAIVTSYIYWYTSFCPRTHCLNSALGSRTSQSQKRWRQFAPGPKLRREVGGRWAYRKRKGVQHAFDPKIPLQVSAWITPLTKPTTLLVLEELNNIRALSSSRPESSHHFPDTGESA